MRKFFTFLTFFLLIVGGAMAQSTFSNPYKGYTHKYKADVESGYTTRWYVTTDYEGQNLATVNIDFNITSLCSGSSTLTGSIIEGTDLDSVSIEWLSTLTEATYYVFFEIDALSADGGCTNKMAMKVDIAGGFNALAYNITGSADFDAADEGDSDIKPNDCPDDIVNAVYNGSSGHTDIGNTEVVFKVEREYSTLAWNFEYEASVTATENGVTASIDSIVIKNEAGTVLAKATSVTANTVSDIAADQDYAIAYVYVKNVQGSAVKVDFNLITANSNTADNDSPANTDSEATDNEATYTINEIPVINSLFGAN